MRLLVVHYPRCELVVSEEIIGRSLPTVRGLLVVHYLRCDIVVSEEIISRTLPTVRISG